MSDEAAAANSDTKQTEAQQALMPSQVKSASKKKGNPRRPPNKKKQMTANGSTTPPASLATADASANTDAKPPSADEAKAINGSQRNDNGDNRNSEAPKKGRNRKRVNNRNKQNADHTSKLDQYQSNNVNVNGNGNNDQDQGNKLNNNNNSKKNKAKKKFPWRKFIPQGTVDPITLDNLISLPYPPFAIVASAPYVPVPIWPVPEFKISEASSKDTRHVKRTAEELEELNRQRLKDQWGNQLSSDAAAAQKLQQDADKEEADKQRNRALNLYDGRALAYYLVSQLQFIDPLNRRDLTRDEICNLDKYLRRNGFSEAASVTEAYDTKGITLSTAGAAAATAQGRAEILQQTAQTLLQSLFGGSSVSAQPAMTPLQAQYAAMQQQEQQQQGARQRRPSSRDDNRGIFASEDGGLMVIDDDENPGLRGGGSYRASSNASALNPNAASYGAGNLRSAASRVAGRPISSVSFPALPTAPVSAPEASAVSTAPAKDLKVPLPGSKASKTLSRITGAIKKTNPEEQQRQWEAREAARKKAMMTNLIFGVNPVANQAQNGMQTVSMSAPPTMVSDEKLERNRNLAEALGVQPATMRQQQLNSGWARDAGADGRVALDEFGNELNAAIYPEGLIMSARDRMPLLLKLEKKWKTFLSDDSTPSLPLNPMDRAARSFAHHYSDFWKLRTESFDPEPKRYIHCVKLVDTCTPQPLLSDVARSWRPGVTPTQESVAAALAATQAIKQQELDRAALQAAGDQPLESSIANQSVDAIPAENPPVEGGVDVAAMVGLSVSGTQGPLSMLEERVGGRFYALTSAPKERAKLDLAKRTIPLELAPVEAEEKYDIHVSRKESQAKQSEKARKAQEAAARRDKALADAFASDSDNDDDDDGPEKVAGDDSDWDEPEALYQNSDDEED